jgi:hypothetical protein
MPICLQDWRMGLQLRDASPWEHVDRTIADGARWSGVDVTVTSDVGLLRAGDDVQCACAQDNIRLWGWFVYFSTWRR